MLLCIFFGAAIACGYAMLADLSDILFILGFCPAILVLVPMFLVLAWLLRQVAPVRSARLLSFQLLLFGLAYPVIAGLDIERQSLYFNMCALSAFGFIASTGSAQKLRNYPGNAVTDSNQSPSRNGLVTSALASERAAQSPLSRSEQHAIEPCRVRRASIQHRDWTASVVCDLESAPVGQRKISRKLYREVLSGRTIDKKLKSLPGQARGAAQGRGTLIHDEIHHLAAARCVGTLVQDTRVAALGQSLLIETNIPNTLKTQQRVVTARVSSSV